MEVLLSDTMYQTIRAMYKTTKDKRTATYLNIILLKHKQYSQKEIAEILNIDENTVCTWVKKFETSSTLAEYLQLKYIKPVGKMSYGSIGKIVNFIEKTAFTDTKPIIKYIEEHFNAKYSVSGITKLLKRLTFSYKQKVALPSKIDTEKQANFVKEYEDIENNLTDKCAIFFGCITNSHIIFCTPNNSWCGSK